MLVKNKQPRSHSCSAALVMKWLKRWRLPASVSDTNLTGGQTKTQSVCTVGTARIKYWIFSWTFWRHWTWPRPSWSLRQNNIKYFVFWVITLREVIWNWRFGINHRSHIQGLSWKLVWQLVSKPRFQTTSRLIITQKMEEFKSTKVLAISLENTKAI
jgi:hypothetical protein